jgi:3-phenylpropionate/trans-cinnamate dioxygenase ferredoxin reductase subunit
MTSYDVLIVGGGHGGAQAAIALRQQGFAGTIAIVGAEPDPPYERPPLSKDYLAGEKDFERLLIRPLAFWAERGIDLILGQAVLQVDPAARTVTRADGETLGYGALIWAAGGRPRRLSCPGFEHVHMIRGRSDSDRLLARLAGVRRVAVIGGGYIGLETAAVLRKLGREVVLLEAMDRLLSRVAGAPISEFYAAEHRARGVEVRTGIGIAAVAADGVELADGEVVKADLVVAGVGIEAEVGPLAAAGAETGNGDIIPAVLIVAGIGIDAAIGPLAEAGAETANGVHIDEFCRTSLPDVYAIGDCAAQSPIA